MLKNFKADLHIHTCLSPCSELEMSPLSIVEKASEKGLDIIAITDHNSAENVVAAQRAADNLNLTVLSGMEVSSAEEAHIIALFEGAEEALALQNEVYENLMTGENDEKRFGEQIVVNEKDEVMGFNKRLLIASTSLTAHDIVNKVHSLGGIAIASHIDRDFFSILSQLGFIPEDLHFDSLEISRQIRREQAEELYKNYRSYTWISASDAHRLEDIGKRSTIFLMREPAFEEIRLALQNKEGRQAKWE